MDFPAQHVSLQRTAGGDARATGQAARHAITDRRWTIADSRAKATHAGFATTWLRAFSWNRGLASLNPGYSCGRRSAAAAALRSRSNMSSMQ